MSQQPQQPPETIQYNHEDADKTATMLLLQDQQQQPVFVHHNHEDEDKSRSRWSLPPEELDEDLVAESRRTPPTVAPSYHSTRLFLLGVPVVVAVVLLLSIVLYWIVKKRRATAKHQFLTTVSKFPVADLEVRKATTGGWHGKYTEHLLHNNEDYYNIHDQHNSRGERSPIDIEHTSFQSHASALLNDTIDTNRASYNLRSTQLFADQNDFDTSDDDNSFLLDDDDDDSDKEGIFAAVKALLSQNRKKRDEEKDTNEDFKQKLSVGI